MRNLNLARIFGSGEGPGHKSYSMNSTKFLNKKGRFIGQRFRRMEDQKPGPWLACNLGFAKEDLNQKLKRFRKLSKLGDVVNKLV